MNEILDEDLTPKRPTKKSIYGRYSNIPASIVILSALFKIMHWPYGDELLFIGISAHLGIELGYLIALKGQSKLNLKRSLIAVFFFVMITRPWNLNNTYLETAEWYVILTILSACIVLTYLVVSRQAAKKNLNV